MRVAFLLGSMNRGGAETLVLDVFRNAGTHGLDIVGIHRKKGDLYLDYTKTEPPLINIYPKNKYDILYVFKLRRTLKKHKVSIAHAQHSLDAFYCILACFNTKIRVVVTFHGFSINKPRWYSIITRFVLKKADLNCFVSNTQQKFYESNYGIIPAARKRVIYNGIDGAKFNNSPDLLFRKKLGLSKKITLLGSVGNFNSGRDQLTICKALKLLDKKGIDFRFIFVGAKQPRTPDYYDDCVKYCDENQLNKKVLFLGPRNDVPKLLYEMDAFIYSSRHDTFGMAVIEAMMSGIPVIANDWETMLEITENGKYGQIYNSESSIDLSEKIIQLINDLDKFKRASKKHKPIIYGKYDIGAYINRLESIYTGIL